MWPAKAAALAWLVVFGSKLLLLGACVGATADVDWGVTVKHSRAAAAVVVTSTQSAACPAFDACTGLSR
jgi:hypothetical protein